MNDSGLYGTGYHLDYDDSIDQHIAQRNTLDLISRKAQSLNSFCIANPYVDEYDYNVFEMTNALHNIREILEKSLKMFRNHKDISSSFMF